MALDEAAQLGLVLAGPGVDGVITCVDFLAFQAVVFLYDLAQPDPRRFRRRLCRLLISMIDCHEHPESFRLQ